MNDNKILQNKLYLYLTEFFAGMSVMAVELGASRLLAPYFSSSQIVWTIIIGTIMIAMALGNIWGGRNADKNPNPDRLYKRLLVAAVWIAAIPALGRFVILGISGLLVISIRSGFLVIAAFASCMVIFVFPLFLLGTVTPSLAKYTVGSLDDSGKTVGALGAFNTVGSIIGTFVPTFITIPAVGTSVTFLIFSGILLALGLVYFIAGRKNLLGCVIAAVLFLLCSIFGNWGSFAFWEKDLAYEGESVYNYLQVKETDRSVILSTNVLFGVQSILMKDASLTGMYYDYAMAAPLMTDKGRSLCGEEAADAPASGEAQADTVNILILGMGTGTYAKQCMQYFENVSAEGVEIDSRITDLAHQYFALPPSVEVTAYDGRAYLQAVDKRYDVIMVDAYQDITIPFQMSSVEFFTLVKAHLTKNGVMVVNMNMHSEKAGNINAYLGDTIANVFSQVYVVDVAGSTNRELFASENPQMLQRFSEGTELLENESLAAMMDTVGRNLCPYEQGEYLLTDDRAPVELLGMEVIDELIQDELGYYRELFQKEGLAGFLKEL